MERIISIGEINRLARLMISHKRRMSAWPLLVLIELSRKDGFYSLKEIVKCVDVDVKHNKMQYGYIFKPLIELGLVEMRKVEGVGSQFASWQIKLSEHIHVIEQDSFDFKEVLSVYYLACSYMQVNRKTSPLLLLVLIGIKIRKIQSTDMLKHFCKVNISNGNSSHLNILNNLVILGVISLVKTAEFMAAPVLIFEVET